MARYFQRKKILRMGPLSHTLTPTPPCLPPLPDFCTLLSLLSWGGDAVLLCKEGRAKGLSCQNWGCQVFRKDKFPLIAGLVSIALFFLGFGIGEHYWLWQPWWVPKFLNTLILAMTGLSLAGLITGVSYLYERIFKPLIIIGTVLSGLTTILSASVIYWSFPL